MEENNQSLGTLPEGVIVYNRFVRTRNVLLSEIDCTDLFVTMENHRRKNGIECNEEIDHLFRQLLAAFTLHCASRPRNEMMAWTIRYGNPLASFFFAGDTEIGSVTGRFFLKNIKEGELGEMHQELHRPRKEPHISMVEFSGNTAQAAIHQFYNVSEQRPARFFDLGENHFALVSAHPDYDEGWFTHLDLETVVGLPEKEELNLLETRPYYWLCGCSREKIMEMLAPIMKEQPDSIFGDGDSAIVNCPRCGSNYPLNRTELTEYTQSLPPSED